jgi:hypothetical protein
MEQEISHRLSRWLIRSRERNDQAGFALLPSLVGISEQQVPQMKKCRPRRVCPAATPRFLSRWRSK